MADDDGDDNDASSTTAGASVTSVRASPIPEARRVARSVTEPSNLKPLLAQRLLDAYPHENHLRLALRQREPYNAHLRESPSAGTSKRPGTASQLRSASGTFGAPERPPSAGHAALGLYGERGRKGQSRSAARLQTTASCTSLAPQAPCGPGWQLVDGHGKPVQYTLGANGWHSQQRGAAAGRSSSAACLHAPASSSSAPMGAGPREVVVSIPRVAPERAEYDDDGVSRALLLARRAADGERLDTDELGEIVSIATGMLGSRSK